MPRRAGVPDPTGRRALLKQATAAGALLWAAPVVDSFVSVAAAASTIATATVGLFKSSNGSADPSLTSLCGTGAASPAPRGTAVFTRASGGGMICVTGTLSTGADAQSRDIYILQSTAGGTCVGGTVTKVGSWAATPSSGPQTFCAPVAPGATHFVVAQQLSGGGGNDGWSSKPPISLP